MRNEQRAGSKQGKMCVFLRGKPILSPQGDTYDQYRYRASVFLKDGTYLPCVVFQSKELQVELALRRFDELRNKSSQYRMVVESFVASGSRLANYEIKTVEPSPFA